MTYPGEPTISPGGVSVVAVRRRAGGNQVFGRSRGRRHDLPPGVCHRAVEETGGTGGGAVRRRRGPGRSRVGAAPSWLIFSPSGLRLGHRSHPQPLAAGPPRSLPGEADALGVPERKAPRRVVRGRPARDGAGFADPAVRRESGSLATPAFQLGTVATRLAAELPRGPAASGGGGAGFRLPYPALLAARLRSAAAACGLKR